MQIGEYSYKGFKYTVEFTDKGDWRHNKNKFYASNGLFTSDYHKEFDKAVKEFKCLVDEFLKNRVTTVDELVDKLSELLVWTGYEDCHFDTDAAKILINDFIKHVKETS